MIAPSRLSGTPSLSTDTTRIYNVIESGDDALRVKDDASIRRYNGERPYPLDLGLTQHENAWRQSVFENYLEALKDPQSLVTLELDPYALADAWRDGGRAIRRVGVCIADRFCDV